MDIMLKRFGSPEVIPGAFLHAAYGRCAGVVCFLPSDGKNI